MPAWNRNRLTAKLGIEYPIQGPFGVFSSQKTDGKRFPTLEDSGRSVRTAWSRKRSRK